MPKQPQTMSSGKTGNLRDSLRTMGRKQFIPLRPL